MMMMRCTLVAIDDDDVVLTKKYREGPPRFDDLHRSTNQANLVPPCVQEASLLGRGTLHNQSTNKPLALREGVGEGRHSSSSSASLASSICKRPRESSKRDPQLKRSALTRKKSGGGFKEH